MAATAPADRDNGPGRKPWALRVLCGVVLVAALREAQPLLSPVVIAALLALVLAPWVRGLRRHAGMPEALGAALVVLALLASAVPLAIAVARPAALAWEHAPATLAQLAARLRQMQAVLPGLEGRAETARQPGRRSAPAPLSGEPAFRVTDPLTERLAAEGLAFTEQVLGRGVAFAVSATATLILLYFLLASEHWLLARLVQALPPGRSRALLLGGLRASQRDIGRYLAALSAINLAEAVLTALALWALGVPHPTLWGVGVAVLLFVPYIGPLALMAALLLAGWTGPQTGLAVFAPFAAFASLHALETNLLSPWLVGRRLALSPVAVLLAVMFWGWIWGIAGAVIAVPLLIALRNVCKRSKRWRSWCGFLDGNLRPAVSLRKLLQPERPANPAKRPSTDLKVHKATGPVPPDSAEVREPRLEHQR